MCMSIHRKAVTYARLIAKSRYDSLTSGLLRPPCFFRRSLLLYKLGFLNNGKRLPGVLAQRVRYLNVLLECTWNAILTVTFFKVKINGLQ